MPCEVTIVDVLVPRGWTNPASVRTSTHGSVSLYEGVAVRIPDFELPIREDALYLGSDIRKLETPEIPRYRELVRERLGAHGWSSTVFDIYRARVLFPIVHAFVNLRVDAIPR